MNTFLSSISSKETYKIFPIPFIISLTAYILFLILNKTIYFSREFKIVKKSIIKDFFTKSLTKKHEQSKLYYLYFEDLQKNSLVWKNQNTIKLTHMESVVSLAERTNEHQQGFTSPKKNKQVHSFNNSNFDQDEENQEGEEFYEIKFKKSQANFKSKESRKIKQDSQFSSNEDSESNIFKHHYAGYSQPYAFVLVSCLEGLLEGLTLGILNHLGILLFFCLTILLHKFTETTMLCITLIVNKVKYIQIVVLMGVYSIVEPIGITVGWMASENELIDATILAFASGAFLYIIGTEDLNDLFEMGGNSKSIKLLHYIVFSIGILLTILIWCADFELNN